MLLHSDKLLRASIATAGMVGAVLALPYRAIGACSTNSIQGGIDCAPASPVTMTTAITRIVNTLLFIVGVASVIMIIVGGFRYILSGGNSQQAGAAKDTILYAVIGLVVALLAYAIANFVIKQF